MTQPNFSTRNRLEGAARAAGVQRASCYLPSAMFSLPTAWPAWLSRRLTPPGRVPLHARADRGAELDEATVRELWTLRCRIFQLKPELDPETDWRWFRSVLQRSTAVWRYFSEDGRLVGFWEYRLQPIELDREPVLVLIFNFTFLERAYRGHPVLMATAAQTLAPLLARSFRVPVVVMGVGYPQSWMVVTRRGVHIEADGEGPPSSLLQRVMRRMRPEMTGAASDSPPRVISMNTIPELPGERWMARHRDDPEYHRYEALNPRWREGFGLYGAVIVRWSAVLSVARTALRRRQ